MLFCIAVSGQQKFSSTKLQACWQEDKTMFDTCLQNFIQGLNADFKTGIKELGVQVLDPMHISNINFQETASIVQIAAVFKDVIVRGASEYKIVNVTSNRPQKQIKIDITIPELKINGNYDISGSVLLLPIKGQGTFWVVLSGISGSGLATLARIGDKVQITDMPVDFQIQTIRLRLNNLFGGDIVGDAVNQALNDNSHQVLEDVKPKVAQQLSTAILKILNEAFRNIAPEVFNL